MISTSQKEHLTYTLILQGLILLGVLMLGWTYIIPGMSKISANQESAQNTIDSYNQVKNSGLSYDQVTTIITKQEGKEELLKIMQSAPEKTKEVIQKNVEGDYITWLENVISTSEEDKKKLSQAKQMINSILPTLSPISSSVDEEYITLKGYIQFIESKFLSTFDIKSNIVLGIQEVNYKGGSKANIGTFDLRLDFRATNNNIKKLITYVNESGNPEILSFSGLLTEGNVPKILSNPLMTVEGLSLENVLDKPEVINNGRIVIRFYVRGGSTEDVKFLTEAIRARKNTLQKKIKKTLEDCIATGNLCSNKTAIEAFEKKYSEFSQSLDTSLALESNNITILGQTAMSIASLSNELELIIQKK